MRTICSLLSFGFAEKALSWQNVFRSFSSSSGLRSVFEKFRLRDGLVCKVGLTVEKKLARF